MISTNSSRRICHEILGIVAVGRGVGVTDLLVPRCPHGDHDMFDAHALYPGPALAHKRRRTCLLPVSGTPMWEADWLVHPAVAPNLPAPNCGGPWYAHVEEGLTTHATALFGRSLSLSATSHSPVLGHSPQPCVAQHQTVGQQRLS